METVTQEPQPIVSTVEQKKLEAAEFTFQKIKELVEAGKSNVEATKIVYESVKGNEFREEQALAKLLEYFNLKEEVDNRAVELKSTYPAYSAFFDNDEVIDTPAANDARFAVKK